MPAKVVAISNRLRQPDNLLTIHGRDSRLCAPASRRVCPYRVQSLFLKNITAHVPIRVPTAQLLNNFLNRLSTIYHLKSVNFSVISRFELIQGLGNFVPDASLFRSVWPVLQHDAKQMRSGKIHDGKRLGTFKSWVSVVSPKR